jgi:hypothetical protein
MKKLILPFALLLIFILSSCSRDSNSTPIDPVQGQWKLVNVTGTFAGINHDFNPGLITWTFNPITQTVTVVNNNTDDSKWDSFDTGVYNYQIATDEQDYPCDEIIKVDGGNMGCFTVSGTNLVIDQSVADGITLTFVE